MLPATLAYARHNSKVWKRHLGTAGLNPTAAINISSIVATKAIPGSTYYHHQTVNMWQINLASAPTSWLGISQVTIANATNTQNNGTFKIVTCDIANNCIYIVNGAGVRQAGAAGTVTPAGVADNSALDPGTPIMNNNNELVAIRYGLANGQTDVFTTYINTEGGSKDLVIQVVNNGSGAIAASANGGITWSLDGVNWNTFPVAITQPAINAGATTGYIVNNYFSGCYIKLTVIGSATTTYYVLLG